MERSFWQKTRWKLVWTVIICIIVWILSGLVGFPRIFQWMFIGYVIGGLLFFILLDARPMKEKSGIAAVFNVIIFYLIISFLFTINGVLWPQYDPEEEKIKIAKLIKAKEKMSRSDLEAKVEELTRKVEEMSASGVSAIPAAEIAKKTQEKKAGPEATKAGLSPALISKGIEVVYLYPL